MKYYRINVTMKTGFKYSYTCIARMMPGMKASSESYWTESIEVTEITKEEHFKSNHVDFKKVPVDSKEPSKRVETPKRVVESKPVRKKIPKMASLEDFFEGDEKPKRKKK